MVSIHPPISNSFCSLSNSLGMVSSLPFTIGITVTLVFHSFLRSLARSKNLSLLNFLKNFLFVVRWDDKIHYTASYHYYHYCFSNYLFYLRSSSCSWSLLISYQSFTCSIQRIPVIAHMISDDRRWGVTGVWSHPFTSSDQHVFLIRPLLRRLNLNHSWHHFPLNSPYSPFSYPTPVASSEFSN